MPDAKATAAADYVANRYNKSPTQLSADELLSLVAAFTAGWDAGTSYAQRTQVPYTPNPWRTEKPDAQ